ncbi:MAG TPA: translocation/assembly module TamB domain-containing protein [bacterium]
MSKLIKYFSYALLAVIVLVLLLAVFTQTPFFKNWLKNKIVRLAEPHLNGTLQLGSLQGNLFTYFQIDDLALTVDDTSCLKLPRLFVRFNPYALLNRKILLRQIILQAPEIHLIQVDSTNWNFQRILKPAPADTSKKFNWSVAAPNIVLATGVVEVRALRTTPVAIPKRIENLNVMLGVWLNENETQISLENLSFDSQEPNLSFRTSQSNLQFSREGLQARDLEIQTEASKLSSNVEIRNFNDPFIDALVQGLPISLAELRRAFPSFEIYGDPKLVFKVRGPLNQLEVSSRLWMGGNDITASGNLQLKESPFRYELKGEVAHLNLADFTHDSSLASNLNFDFEIAGAGVEFGKMNGLLTVALDTSQMFGLRFEPIAGQFEMADSTLTFSLRTQSRGAIADVSGSLNFMRKLIAYQMHAEINDFDVRPFMDSTLVYSDLDLRLDVDGEGVDLETLLGNLSLDIAPSTINGVPIDSAHFQLQIKEKTLNLKEFWVASPLAKITAAGDISIHKENHLQVDAEFIDFSVLAGAMPVDSLAGCGRFSGRFEGPLDSLLVSTTIELSEFAGIDFQVGQFTATAKGVYSSSGSRFELAGQTDTTAAFGVTELRSDFRLNYADSVIQFRIAAQKSDDISAVTAGELHWDDAGYDVILRELELNLLQQLWQKKNEPSIIRISQDGYAISDLVLHNGEQMFFLSGKLNLEQDNDLTLRMQNVDLANYRVFLEEDVNLNGRLDAELLFLGNMAEPELKGNFQIANLEYYQVPFENFSGLVDFSADTLAWKAVLSKVTNDSLMETSGFVQMKISISPYVFQLLSDQQVVIKVSTRGLDLSFLQLLSPDIKNLKGTLVADIVLRNTLNDLRGIGPIRLFDGQFDLPTLGTKYRDINLVLLLQEKELLIKDFRMKSDGGELSLVGGGLALSEKSLEDFKAHFRANNFRLMNDKRMQAKVKGDLEISGSIQAPKFAGEITVTESRIYYPAWFEYEHLVELTSQPFFIISDDSAVFDSSGAMRFQKKRTTAEGDFTETELYKRLRGELAIYFPRNTWIRGEDTNIEVEGELVAVKEGPEIVLFGSFATIRGYYELFGNRFQISQGEMIFHGEPDPNPEVKIEAVYEFQDAASEDRQKHEFKVAITGTLYAPEFKFTLDEQVAEQQDILSILLFGQRKSDLSVGETYHASNETDLEDRATGLVAGQLLKRLSGKISKELSLDMIQIESGKNLTDSKVRIGKYVTPDVFVSVSQDFGAEGNRKVELEYELPKKLFFLNLLLQASVERRGSTGLDIIWKIEW